MIQSAAQNRRTIFASTITTHNAPTNVTAPAIDEQAEPPAGSALTGNLGSWSAPGGAGPTSYNTQWESCDAEGSRCTAISGAVAQTYTTSAADVGHTLRMLVSAANYDGSTSALSEATGVVAGAATSGGDVEQAAGAASVGSPSAKPQVANGSDASEAARVSLAIRGPLNRTFALRAVRLHGTLVNSGGEPIAAR